MARAGGRPEGKIVGIVYRGVRYDILGMDDADFREVEQFLMTKRKNPLVAIKDELAAAKDNPALQEMLVKLAYDDMRKHKTVDLISRDEVIDYLQTREGGVRSMWLCLRKQIPDLTLEKADEIMGAVSTAEMMAARDEALGGEKGGEEPPAA